MRLLRNVVSCLVPPARGPVRPARAISLVLFLILFSGVCLGLSLGSLVQFTRPLLLGLIVLVTWLWWVHLAGYSGLSKGRAEFSLWVRFALAGVLVAALAEPRFVRKHDQMSVIYVADLSDSLGDKTIPQSMEFIAANVQQKPRDDQAGLVTFGRNAAVEQPSRKSFILEGNQVLINSQIDRDATNIEQALSLATAIIPPETSGRIVLISDGSQTEGSLDRVLGELKSRKIPVDVLPVEYTYNKEVWVERLELPRSVKLGETYEAVVLISALAPGAGKLTLRENDKPIYEQSLKFPAGKSRHVIPITLRETGYYEYTASIEVPSGEDQIAQNNTAMNFILVTGEGKVLVVTDPVGDDRDWESFVASLRRGERSVEVKTANDLPRSALSLMPYDAIVFANVGADYFDIQQMQAIKDSVHELGIGFLMIGGPNSFGPGGYNRTPIEETLPVSMDITQKKVLPKGALVIILHTCEFPDGNTWAKRITKQAIKVLSDQDEAGVIFYGGGGDEWLFDLTEVRNISKLVPLINSAEPGDMPSFQQAMRMGLTSLKKSDASAKHMIIISDGDPQPPSPGLVQEYVDNKVTFSMVAIYPHGGNEITLMRELAKQTGGRYYFPADSRELPSIFIKESKTLKRNMLQNKLVQPEVGAVSPILKGLNGLPKLHGYVLTSAKERLTETVLHVTEDDQQDPILATWGFGLGQSAAFTSDLSTNWGREWVNNTEFDAFTKQLMQKISRVQKLGHLRMYTQNTGTQAIIMVEDFAPEESFLELKATVSGPREKSETIPLKQVGPRRYQGTVPLWGRGRYQVLAAGSAGTRTDTAQDGFIVSYSPEYLRFRSNPLAIKEIAEKTGGNLLSKKTTSDDIYLKNRTIRATSQPIFDWLLIALLILFPLDVAIRRVQIDFKVVRDWFRPKAQPSTQTMNALLKRKKEVNTSLEATRDPTRRPPPLPPGGSTATVTKTPPKPTPGKPPETKPPVEDTNTTSQLLRNKRKRQGES